MGEQKVKETKGDAGRRPAPSFPARVRIETLVAGGDGLGRLQGMAVFVPVTARGELVEVEAVRRAPDYVAARALRVIEPSAARRRPPCSCFPDCGGCQWQHLDYAEQLACKESILVEAFRRLGRFEQVPAERIEPSPSEFHYRHRVQLKVLTAGRRMLWGFYAATSHRLVEIRRCLIAHPAINALLGDLEGFVRGLGVEPSRLGTAEINVDGTGRRLELILHPRRRKLELAAHGRQLSLPSPDGELSVSVANATLVRRMPVVPGRFTFESSGLLLSAGAGAFSQNNLALNPRLVEKVLEFASPEAGREAADVFCGVGNYSLPLARSSSRVWAVENNRRACLFGKENSRAAGLDNVVFVQRDAREALEGLPRGLRTLVLNPPRVGAGPDIMSGIAGLGPERVVYVSCNPATLARDLAYLCAGGYRLERLAPFDMFPQTHHVETVALMLRTRPGTGCPVSGAEIVPREACEN